jgi:hypothetical protein
MGTATYSSVLSVASCSNLLFPKIESGGGPPHSKDSISVGYCDRILHSASTNDEYDCEYEYEYDSLT